ncbi:hypothetical protein SDC9_210264 [bioreactor metagenome]|uniref:Uncharacterized protein n=1 Tax=bioreactor metagenome TaxID=1076179 RepID=A0A645JFP4_9ZZZZ
MDQFDDQSEILLQLDRRLAEQETDVENAEAAYFEEITNQRGAVAFEGFRCDMLEFDDVVGHQPVTACDQLQRQLAFADAGIALDEDAHAQHFEKHTVLRGRFGQALRQVMAQIGHQDRAGQRR